MENVSIPICGVENGTLFFDVLEHEYDPQTSQCVPFAASAPFMLRFVSYFICMLATICICSIAFLSVLLFPRTIRSVKNKSGPEKGAIQLLHAAFCAFTFIGALLMVIASARKLFFVLPINTSSGTVNTLAWVTSIYFNALGVFSYFLSFKEIRVASLVVPLINFPSAKYSLMGLFVYFVAVFVSVAVSLLTGLIRDTFDLLKLLIGGTLPPVLILGIALPDLMVPVMKSIDEVLVQVNESKKEKIPVSTKMSTAQSLVGKSTEQSYKPHELRCASSINPVRNKKMLMETRQMVSRLRRFLQFLTVCTVVLTVSIVFSSLVYQPFLILLFLLLFNGSQLLLVWCLAYFLYCKLQLTKSRRLLARHVKPCLNTTVMTISSTNLQSAIATTKGTDAFDVGKLKDEFYA